VTLQSLDRDHAVVKITFGANRGRVCGVIRSTFPRDTNSVDMALLDGAEGKCARASLQRKPLRLLLDYLLMSNGAVNW
jgi:hypothetical protein